MAEVTASPISAPVMPVKSDISSLVEPEYPYSQSSIGFEVGELITLGGYKRRSFWQWLIGTPRVLKQWRVTNVVKTEPGGINWLEEV